MTSLDKLPGETIETSADVGAAVRELQSGAPFATVATERPGAAAEIIASVLDRGADEGTRVVHVGNPLRSPLTLERLFMQVVGPEADLRIERTPLQLTGLLGRPVGRETRLLVVVQQPDTLDADALQMLGRMAPHFAAAEPRVQMLFCGPAGFEAPEPQRLPALTAPLPDRRPLLALEALEPQPRRRELLPVVILLLLFAGAACVLWDGRGGFGRAHDPVGDAQARPAQPGAAPAVAALPADDTAALRRAFDTFLSQRAPSEARLSPSQKEALFQEFLRRQRQRNAQSGI